MREIPRGRSQAGLSMLEVLVATSLVIVVLLASVQVVTRVAAQIGYARTPQAERAARAKSAALHWLQAELDYLRSRGYGYLTDAYLRCRAGTCPPGWREVDGGAAVERTITPALKEPGESALPRDFAKAVVRVEVEGLEGCSESSDSCVISVMRARVRLYRGETDSDPFVEGATSVVRR